MVAILDRTSGASAEILLGKSDTSRNADAQEQAPLLRGGSSHNGRGIARYEIRPSRITGRLRLLFTDGDAQICQPIFEARPRKLPVAYKTTGCSIRDAPGASPEVR